MNVEQQLVRTIDFARALSRLTSEQRTVIELHSEGWTCKEIATRLNLPKWKPKKRIYEALCAMRMFWGVPLPAKSSHDATPPDSWWPLLVESLWRHASSSGLRIGPDA